MEKKFGAFSSSDNPQELSLTVSSVVKLVAIALSAIGAYKGVDLTISDGELQQVTDALLALVVAGFSIQQSCNLLLGIFKKFTAKF